MVLTRLCAHVVLAEHLDDLEAAHLVLVELGLEVGEVGVLVAVDDLLAAVVGDEVGREEVVHGVLVAHVAVGVREVLLAGLDADEGGLRVELRPEAQARVHAHVGHLHLLLPHDAELVVVRGDALVDDGHEDGDHDREQARQAHVEAGVEEGDLGPGLAVAAAHFFLLRVPQEQTEVVQLVGEGEPVLDDEVLLENGALLRKCHRLSVSSLNQKQKRE